MANFEYAFTSSGTPNSFSIGDSGVVGIDAGGLLTPKVVNIGAGVNVVLTATKTDAELRALFEAFIKRYGGGRGDAGGFPSQATLQVEPTLTAVEAAD